MDEGGLPGEFRLKVEPGRGRSDDAVLLVPFEWRCMGDGAFETPAAHQRADSKGDRRIVAPGDDAILNNESVVLGAERLRRSFEQRPPGFGGGGAQLRASGLD